MSLSITSLFRIQHPIVQAGMVWCSGWKLASAVSNAGGLGLIGAGSMHPLVFRQHIQKCKAATSNSFGVNVPLLYPEMDLLMDIIAEEGVKIVFTSAGSPSKWTRFLKDKGITVVHVVSSSRFAVKSEQAGVDAVVAEGFEAGGHNGREETTTLCLIPLVRQAVTIPVIAAGGIGSGRAMLAVEALGANGVQIGTRFAASVESSAHENFKRKLVHLPEGETMLTMKSVTPVRLIKNDFYKQVQAAEEQGATPDELVTLLGKGRAKKGIFEGNLEEGELEIGQIASQIRSIEPAAEIVASLMSEYQLAKREICQS